MALRPVDGRGRHVAAWFEAPTEESDVRHLQLTIAAWACLAGVQSFAGDVEHDAAAAPAGVANAAPGQDVQAPSAFDGYRRFDPYPDTFDWRAANDEVGRLGGFAGHLGGSARDGERGGGEGDR